MWRRGPVQGEETRILCQIHTDMARHIQTGDPRVENLAGVWSRRLSFHTLSFFSSNQRSEHDDARHCQLLQLIKVVACSTMTRLQGTGD